MNLNIKITLPIILTYSKLTLTNIFCVFFEILFPVFILVILHIMTCIHCSATYFLFCLVIGHTFLSVS